MKKVLSIILCSCLIGICMTCVSYAVDSEKACTNQEIVWKDVGNKSVHLSNDIMYDVGFYVSEPFKKEENASESYKKAKLVGKFYSNGKKEINLKNSLEVTFKYDGQNACVENSDKDIVQTASINTSDKLKTTTKNEVYVSPNQCIVSSQTELYKKRKWYDFRKTWGSLDNFHTDIVCSSDGNIDFNCKSLSSMPNQEFEIKNISNTTESIDNKLDRVVNVSDKIYTSKAKNKDQYNYKTRRLDILYKDKKGHDLAIVTIEVNFRYNKISHEVECISTSHREVELADDWYVDLYSLRSGDETRNKGGAYGIIILSHEETLSYDKYHDYIFVKCDSQGNINDNICIR